MLQWRKSLKFLPKTFYRATLQAFNGHLTVNATALEEHFPEEIRASRKIHTQSLTGIPQKIKSEDQTRTVLCWAYERISGLPNLLLGRCEHVAQSVLN